MDLLEQPKILGGYNVPSISYACSICAILVELSETKQINK